MKSSKETQLAGFLLFAGTIVILITIAFEYTSGWIGTERPEEQVPIFIYENWGALKSIWSWQVSGYVLWTCAFLLFIKNSKDFYSLVSAFLIISSLSMVIAFLITLGGYYPALQVYTVEPALFDSLRGAVRAVYTAGMSGILMLGGVFLYETFQSNGFINKSTGITTLIVVIVLVVLGAATPMPLKVLGASIFFFPLVLGYSIWRSKTD